MHSAAQKFTFFLFFNNYYNSKIQCNRKGMAVMADHEALCTEDIQTKGQRLESTKTKKFGISYRWTLLSR
jgi:hypothetical protein